MAFPSVFMELPAFQFYKSILNNVCGDGNIRTLSALLCTVCCAGIIQRHTLFTRGNVFSSVSYLAIR